MIVDKIQKKLLRNQERVLSVQTTDQLAMVLNCLGSKSQVKLEKQGARKKNSTKGQGRRTVSRVLNHLLNQDSSYNLTVPRGKGEEQHLGFSITD